MEERLHGADGVRVEPAGAELDAQALVQLAQLLAGFLHGKEQRMSFCCSACRLEKLTRAALEGADDEGEALLACAAYLSFAAGAASFLGWARRYIASEIPAAIVVTPSMMRESSIHLPTPLSTAAAMATYSDGDEMGPRRSLKTLQPQSSFALL